MKSYKDCSDSFALDNVIFNESGSSESSVFVCKTKYNVVTFNDTLDVKTCGGFRLCWYIEYISLKLHVVQCDVWLVLLRRHLRARMLFMSGSRVGGSGMIS